MRFAILGLLLAAAIFLISGGHITTPAAATTPRAVAPAAAVAQPTRLFAAFRTRFGGSRSRYGYGYGYGRRPSLLHRVVKTAIWLYIVHLFFTHGGLSILLWMIIIGFVLSLGRRRRRYSQRAPSFRQ